ncbi:hypothetical protein [Aquibacillus rhizosphaerae]|uniref:ABC transporter permease n=1 Tax=Aquibacillus rhizosphaerae TaxID=3051431 RepID=A0ABT7L840_9BACI|nr:hypothetical protein [Aquibacillus sp. LR5S19]MDL4842025.1 hypothetical protein [Aquibacillus sp. LR5S19]
MHNFLSLKILDKCERMFSTFGIDYNLMRQILQVKLTMDQRRVPTIFNQNAKQETKNQFLKSLGLYALYGLILIPFIVFGENYIFQMGIVFGIAMFMLMMSMISDFSTVLLDIRDKTILDTKPISDKTVSVAKMVHVCIYMTQLTGAFALIPLVVGLFTQGILFTLIFIVELVLMGLFIVVLTALIYIFILRFFSGERLKDIINYVQILLSISIIVGYQIVARSFEFVELDVSFTFQWWHVLIPPIWFGAPYELILNQQLSNTNIVLSLLVLLIPILSIFIYARLVPSFERNLQKLLNNSGTNKKKRMRINQVWQRLVCRSELEKTFFQFSSLILKQEREFKLKVYPSLGMGIVFPFIFLFSYISTNSFEELSSSKLYVTIHFCNLIILTVVHMLRYSSNYKAAWIYQTAPINNKFVIYRATLKAFLVKLYIPIFGLVSIIFIAIFSYQIIPDLIIVFLTALLITIITYRLINNKVYPFSESFAFAQDSSTTAITFLIMFIIAISAGVHFMITTIPFGIYAYGVILFVANLISWKKILPTKVAISKR